MGVVETEKNIMKKFQDLSRASTSSFSYLVDIIIVQRLVKRA